MSEPTDNDDVKLHLQEAEELKKQWFSYVYESIQTLNEKIEKNVFQLQKEKEELLKLLVQYRDELLAVIKENDLEHKKDLEKLRDNLEKIIDTIKNRLSSLTNKNTELKLLIETELNSLKAEFRDNLESTLQAHIESDAKLFDAINKRFVAVEDDVKTMQGIQTVVKTKLGVYILMISLGVTAFVSTLAGGILILFKDAIKAYLGVE